MNENPIKVKVVEENYKIREEDPCKFIGPTKMTFNRY
jgi:hypothetical protein